jgi:hypothetical protein
LFAAALQRLEMQFRPALDLAAVLFERVLDLERVEG